MKKRPTVAVSVAVSVAVLFSVAAYGEEAKPAEESLDSQLQALSLPENGSPVPISSEKLYAIQTRFAPLKGRHEISVGFGKNLSPPSYLSSQQIDANYRLHLSDRWSLGVGGSYVTNALTDAGQRLQDIQGGLVPDAAYTKYRANASVTYNVFYGKFRLGMDTVLYFDQYLSLGPSYVIQDLGKSIGGFGDIGMVLWFGKTGSLRIGLKDYLFKETRHLSSSTVQDLVFHLDVGLLFGNGGST